MAARIIAILAATTALRAVKWLPVRESGQAARNERVGNVTRAINDYEHLHFSVHLESTTVVCAQNACWDAPIRRSSVAVKSTDEHNHISIIIPAAHRPPPSPAEDIHLNHPSNHLNSFTWAHVDYDYLKKLRCCSQMSHTQYNRATKKLRWSVEAATRAVNGQLQTAFSLLTINLDQLAVTLPRNTCRLVILLGLCQQVYAGKDEDSSSAIPRCHIFEGVSASFVPWLISFTAWIAWKRPELVGLLNGTSRLPTYQNAAQPQPEEREARKQWLLYNTQLYGAVVSHVAQHIQAALHVHANGRGRMAIRHLKERYGSQSTGDRAEATARLQKSYFDPRSKIAESDVMRQYNQMSLALADIIASGGQRADDQLLISFFENSLPISYATIRQMVRYKEHDNFDAYYNDFLTQVKAEERSTQLNSNAGVFTVNTPNRVDGQNLKPRNTRGPQDYRGGKPNNERSETKNPCFNCGQFDHLRKRCPCPAVTCSHCGANHLNELCSKGPGGPLRDSLSVNAKLLLDRNYNNKRTLSSGSNQSSSSSAYVAGSGSTVTPEWLFRQYQNYSSQQRSSQASTSSQSSHSNERRADEPSTSSDPSAHTITTDDVRDLEVTNFLNTLHPHAFVVDDAAAFAAATHMKDLHHLAFIDSQASSFVVPSAEYLSIITDQSPSTAVNTANGAVRPECIGDMTIKLQSDDGKWYTFEISGVWVLPSCNRVLYSQSIMKQKGITHHLDQGYIVLPDGARKSINLPSYTVEVSFVRHAVMAARSISIPLPRNLASTSDRGADSKSSVPQQLLWHRLGFPSRNIWLRMQDVAVDHGLPDTTRLKYDFPMLDSVARARARMLPFHESRDPESLPAPGAVIYLDFAGPMTLSYPHKYTYYCGAVDAGSGFSRIVPCHHPTKEVATQCLELLLGDLTALMGLSHKLKPQVIVSDQGGQFMSRHFKDFLAMEQIKHWPAVVYNPQQNSIVERMWGTRFGMARALLKFANLGPSMHPFALQCANWICNRLPQSSRGNLSPWFILSRRPASIGYLRSFGCLVRMTIPKARRDSDHHFADRGALGIYLGPSELSPGCVVYVPSDRKFYVTRDVIAYEDVHPGVKHIESAWPPIDESASDLEGDKQRRYNELSTSVLHNLISREPVPALLRESTVYDEPLDEKVDDHHAADGIELPNDQSQDPPDALDRGAEVGEQARVPLNSGEDDPSSRRFKRVLPARSTRYTGAYFTDPTVATPLQAIANLHLCLAPDEVMDFGVFAYESSIAGLGTAYAVKATADMGELVIPRGYNQCLKSPESQYWREAVAKEYNGLLSIGTFEFVPRSSLKTGTNVMRCHLVFDVKRKSDGSIEKFKARLVADGNTQQYGVDFDRVFSTVAKLSTLRLLLVLAACKDYNLSSIDIRQAYLQATLSEELYMEVPPGLDDADRDGNPLVVRLRRSLYGLKQAGREWHTLLAATLQEWGFVQSKIDVCMFTYTRGESQLYVVVWVDDCVIADNDANLREEFVSWLGTKFPVEDKSELNWILHVKVSRDRSHRTISLSQELYVRDLLGRYDYLHGGLTRRFDSPCDSNVKLCPEQSPAVDSAEYANMAKYRSDYMSLVGAFLWLANVSRPELSFIAGQLARFVSNPGMVHYRAALRVLIYLRGDPTRDLVFRPSVHLGFRAYVDSDWAQKFSVSGGFMEYMGCPIHWFSKMQRSVSMSSTEAEYFATCLAAREVVYFRELLVDFGHAQSGPTIILTDNKGVVDLSLDPIAFKKTKHILRAANYVRDLCARQIVVLKWVSSAHNVADICTKAVSLATFRALMNLLGHLTSVP